MDYFGYKLSVHLADLSPFMKNIADRWEFDPFWDIDNQHECIETEFTDYIGVMKNEE